MGTLSLLTDEKQFDNRQMNFYLFLRREILIKLMTTFQILLNSYVCNGLYKKIYRVFFALLCVTCYCKETFLAVSIAKNEE